MTLHDTLLADMKSAMKDKEGSKLKLSVIRMIRAAVQNAQIEKKNPLSEEVVLDVVVREMKMRQDAIDAVPPEERERRQEYLQKLEEEKVILQAYLPKPFSMEELQSVVAEAIAETGANSPKDMGRVMGVLMPRVKGKADGKTVNSVVKELLSRKEE
jgi:uncharacterized protein YqeY